MILRNQTKVVHIGGVPVGGGHPIVIQSMTNTDTRDISATVAQIKALEMAGCEIVRVAVPDVEAATAIKQIKKEISIPLVADIHFDYKLAIMAVENGADKLRINPGNIGSEDHVRQVAEAAKANNLPIRVGVNGGSLEKEIVKKYGGVTAEGLAESALHNVSLLEKCGFENIVVSVKASNVPLILDSHKILAERIPYPLHLGLTEAGTPYKGAIRSAAGLGALLNLGLGDTIRVSLAGDPVQEIQAAKVILEAMGLRRFGVTVIACPTCGRTDLDVAKIALQVEERLAHVTNPITIAVMGCAVNGPGEAREADIGVAGGRNGAVLFRKGQVIRHIPECEIVETIVQEVFHTLPDS